MGPRRRGDRGGGVRRRSHPACRSFFELPLRGFDGPAVRGVRRGSRLDSGGLRRRAGGALPSRKNSARAGLRLGRRDRHGRRRDRHARRRRGADDGHPSLRRLCRGSKAGHIGARSPRQRRSRHEGQRRGQDLRQIACASGPCRDRGVDAPDAQRQSLRRCALDAAFASAAEAVAGSADFAARALAPRRHRHRLCGWRLRPARSSVTVFLDRRRRARGGVCAARPRGGACAVARPQAEDRDAGRPLRLLRAEGEIHASRPRGARTCRRLRQPARPRGFSSSPKPSSHQ